jgi:glycosyltransferase involved in cell wall biosynthesis
MASKVSVIMPVLNGERYIGEAIQSIADQTHLDRELVLVDDGSTDGTLERVRAFAGLVDIVFVHHDKPRGIAPSMNDGVRHASGDFISFLDHDDAWFPAFLETQIRHLAQHPDAGLVHSDFRTIDSNGAVIEASVAASRGRRRPSGRVFSQLFMDSFIVGNSVLIRRECFERLGLFDESLRWGDYHMWLRIARHYEVDYVDQVLTSYRQHSTQSTRTPEAAPRVDRPVGLQAIESILALYPDVRAELGNRRIRQRMASFYFDLAYGSLANGDSASARWYAGRALQRWPFDRRYAALYAAALLPRRHSQGARRIWRRIRGLDTSGSSGIRGITR